MKKTAQQIQDEIFKKMSANQKIRLGSSFWKLAKSIDSNKIDFRQKIVNVYYRVNGSTTSTGKNS